MPSQILATRRKTTERPWGKSNPVRGANHVEDATAFIADYPVGTQLSQEEFDEWAETRGHYKVPRKVSKKSDAWVAHVRRRNYLRSLINKAGAHDRMSDPFVIESVGPGHLEVRSPQVAISNASILPKLETVTETHRQKLAYLMQSVDWAALPHYERIFAETIYRDIEMFKAEIDLKVHHLSTKFEALETNLRRKVEAGEIHPRNGGIRGIIDTTKEKKQAK